MIAETISLEFGEPVFDLSVYDSVQILRDLVEDKLITKHRVLPIYRRGNILYIATSNPTNMDAMDAIRFNSKMNIEAIIVEYPQLEKLIEQNFAQADSFEFSDEDIDLDLEQDHQNSNDEEDDSPQGDEAPIVKYINKLLIDAIRMGASDLHFEPYEKSYRVRYRVDGVLACISASPPLQLATRLASRLKVMSQMDISEKRVPQDGRIKLKLSKSKAIDFRVELTSNLIWRKAGSTYSRSIQCYAGD